MMGDRQRWTSWCSAVIALACAWLACTVLAPERAEAQARSALLVLVEEGVRADASLVRAAIGIELDRPVMGPPGPPVPRLEVRADATQLIVRWVPEEGYAIERSVPWPSDDAAVARTAAMLAANLVRDQASDVLASISICPELAVAAPPPPQPPPQSVQTAPLELGDPVIPPPPPDEPLALEPEEPAPPGDLAGLIALSASMGGMSSSATPLFLGTVEGGVRWRELVVGLNVTVGGTDAMQLQFTGSSGPTGSYRAEMIRVNLVPVLSYEPDIGPVRLHFGGGLGITFLDYPSFSGTEGVRAYLRASAGAAYTLAEPLELFAQAWFGTYFESVARWDSYLYDYKPYDGGITVGARFTIR